MARTVKAEQIRKQQRKFPGKKFGRLIDGNFQLRAKRTGRKKHRHVPINRPCGAKKASVGRSGAAQKADKKVHIGRLQRFFVDKRLFGIYNIER